MGVTKSSCLLVLSKSLGKEKERYFVIRKEPTRMEVEKLLIGLPPSSPSLDHSQSWHQVLEPLRELFPSRQVEMPSTSCALREELSLPVCSPKGTPLRTLDLPGFHIDISSKMSTLFTVSQSLSHKTDSGRKEKDGGGVRESHQALDI